jgi:hypothetical protein
MKTTNEIESRKSIGPIGKEKGPPFRAALLFKVPIEALKQILN